MEELQIIKNFYESTDKGSVKWIRVVKNTSDPKLNSVYRCDFVQGEHIEIAPTKYLDANQFSYKYSFRLSFYDSNNYCYKNISPKSGEALSAELSKLYDLIEGKIANLDEKLNLFFNNKINK